ncbi:PilZ domain-containing protein [Paenibacillus uliginis N3/975]|uniref:PilZ domain-containing protein n=1 Tax=Paenibacillus uliginis N3/975 TaxID=1313296 RepID=A0A1X7HNW7_9BACL|nr:PilZ domain-containing protein [Paenibacillus uliginis]SMF89556.1 PilZ domain-containing protein [Paenibacillus uliginis N3/975]
MNLRKEPFRYLFTEPHPCLLELTEFNGTPVSSKPAEAVLINLSKGGCKIVSGLNLHADTNQVVVKLHLPLTETPILCPATIQWQRAQDSTRFEYGLQFQLPPSEKERILVDLRTLAAERKIVVE